MPEQVDQATDQRLMARAVEIALRGEGRVEPNPMVGCVIARGSRVIGGGWHERFGGPHAEVNALRAATEPTEGATAYVTLEPCCHTGKTPPCSQALLAAKIARVVVAVRDPFPKVDGGGLAELRAAGVRVDTGLGEDASRRILAPYLKLTTTGLPWVHAKWAMTLDGKIATHTGSSQWISGEASRGVVHRLRARMDAIVVGRGTAVADNPLLTARLPEGEPPARVATRVVLGAPPRGCRLLATVDEAPVMVVARDATEADTLAWAADAGAEVIAVEAPTPADRFRELLVELGRRRMTNVLVEGGGGVLGSALDAHQAGGGAIDEAHAFVAPKLVGGDSPSPIAGVGIAAMGDALRLGRTEFERLGDDLYLRARTLAR